MTDHQKERLFLFLPPLILAADLAVKALILALFKGEPYPISPSKEILGNFFRLTYVQNYGITFGIFRNLEKPYSTLLLSATSLTALGVLGYFYFNIKKLLLPKGQLPARAALLVIFGGALGNIADRFLRGFVVDYLDFGIGRHRWYTFNLADTCVVSGCIVMALLMMFYEKRPEVS